MGTWGGGLPGLWFRENAVAGSGESCGMVGLHTSLQVTYTVELQLSEPFQTRQIHKKGGTAEESCSRNQCVYIPEAEPDTNQRGGRSSRRGGSCPPLDPPLVYTSK